MTVQQTRVSNKYLDCLGDVELPTQCSDCYTERTCRTNLRRCFGGDEGGNPEWIQERR